MSIGGDTVGDNHHVFFKPKTVDSWLHNAIRSIMEIVSTYNLDGIDIDYEHFEPGADTGIFVECIGRLLYHLKSKRIIKFASIAPFDDDDVQRHYMALWNKYGHLIDYVNFQFYAYDKGTDVQDFVKYFHEQSNNYPGGKVLASFGTDNSGGLRPDGGFFEACGELRRENMFHGIFVWSADDSKKLGFRPEIDSQNFLLADPK
ncbi:Chitinase 2 [Linum grandiflorum]